MKYKNLIATLFTLLIVSSFQYAWGQDNSSEGNGSVGEKLSKIFSLSEGRAEIFSRKRFERNAILNEIDELRTELRSKEARISELAEERTAELLSGRAIASSSAATEVNEQIRKAEFELKNRKARNKFELERLKRKLASIEKVNSQSAAEQQEVKELKNQILDFPVIAKIRLEEDQFRLDNLKKRKLEEQEQRKKFEENIKNIESVRQGRLDDRKKELNTLLSEILDLKIKIRERTEKLDKVNDEISRLIDVSDADTSFRFSISMIFSGLVGLVIIGFFLIIRTNDRVIFEIFSKDSGIQFITLFSIVIAIILFGITGVLEGKELAALLAGLSGYILGRGSGRDRAVSGPPPEEPDPAQIPAGRPAQS